MAKPIPKEWLDLMDANEKRAGLPAGTLHGIVKTETGFQDRFIDDPAAPHYSGPNPKSSAAGLGGILKGTAANPGYGVAPLKDWSAPEQFRFIADYAAARSKHAGSLEAGLAGYGEGKPYAQKVLGNTKVTPVQLAQTSQNVPEVQPSVPIQSTAVNPVVSAPEVNWSQLQQAMPQKPVQVADLAYEEPVAQFSAPQFQMPAYAAAQRIEPNFQRFKSWLGKA